MMAEFSLTPNTAPWIPVLAIGTPTFQLLLKQKAETTWVRNDQYYIIKQIPHMLREHLFIL